MKSILCVAVVATAVCAAIPGAASAAPPVLQSVNFDQTTKVLSVTWTLPPGVESAVIEANTNSALDSEGYFLFGPNDGYYGPNIIFEVPDSAATSWVHSREEGVRAGLCGSAALQAALNHRRVRGREPAASWTAVVELDDSAGHRRRHLPLERLRAGLLQRALPLASRRPGEALPRHAMPIERIPPVHADASHAAAIAGALPAVHTAAFLRLPIVGPVGEPNA